MKRAVLIPLRSVWTLGDGFGRCFSLRFGQAEGNMTIATASSKSYTYVDQLEARLGQRKSIEEERTHNHAL